ncbi:MAG: caspase family protein [Planctomycetota bacterium]
MRAAILPISIAVVLSGLITGCGVTPPKDVFEDKDIKSLQGELAGSLEFKTAAHFILDESKWSEGEKESHTYSIPLDWEDVCQDLSAMVQKFGIFKEMVTLEGAGPESTEEELLVGAREKGADLVVMFKPLKTEVRYDGRDFLMWGADLILWTFLWFPAYFIPDEKFSVELDLEMRVLDAYSGREIYGKTFKGKKSHTFDDFSRGFGILDIWSPILAQWTLAENNYRKVSKALMPHALHQVKKALLKDLAIEFRTALQTPEVQNRITPKVRRLFSIVVGAGNPRGLRRRRLRYAEADARTVWRQFRANREPAMDMDGSTLITGNSATAESIREAIEKLKKSYPRPDEDVLFYFSGFGAVGKGTTGAEPFLVAADTDPRDIEKTAVPLSEIVEALEGLGVARVGLIVDAGFGRRHRGKSLGKAPGVLESPQYPKAPEGQSRSWLLLFAGQTGQRVIEVREFRHGLMTHFLMEALAGKADKDGNGKTSLQEIHDYLKEKVPGLSGMVSLPQEPWAHLGQPNRELVPPKDVPPEEPPEKPGEVPPDEPGEKPAEQPGEAPPDEPGEKPPEEPGEKTPEEPGEAPPEEPGETPPEPPEEPTEPGEEG